MTVADSEGFRKEFIESYRRQCGGLTPFERIVINAFIIAGITFVSTLSINFPPSAQNLWSGFLAATLALLTQIKSITELSDGRKPKRPLGMLI